MKVVQLDDENLDIIVESDRYIDIYSYHNYEHYFDSMNDGEGCLYLDNGKGWRINRLNRLDLQTGIEYELYAEPEICNFDGHRAYQIIYKHQNNKYYRIIEIKHNNRNDFIGNCQEDVRFINDKYSGGYRIFLDEYSDEEERKMARINNYLYDEDLDFENTNSILQAFYEFSKSVYVFGKKEEEPRIVKLIGENKTIYEVTSATNHTDAKIKTKNKNKYERIKDIQKWSI